MAVEIAGYERAEDEYFRARAADLVDVRDRVLRHLLGVRLRAEVAAGSVVVARDLPPSLFLGVDWSKGGAIVLGEGSPTSHVAMLARARGVPMVVGIGGKLADACRHAGRGWRAGFGGCSLPGPRRWPRSSSEGRRLVAR